MRKVARLGVVSVLAALAFSAFAPIANASDEEPTVVVTVTDTSSLVAIA